MKILFAADGSSYTKKALAFLVTHEALLDATSELHVLNVQTNLPPRVKTVAGRELVDNYYLGEAEKVLKPIRKFLDQHRINYRADWVAGNAAVDILKVAKKDKAHMIVMGTHGHGVLGRILMGSVAQRVVAESDTPVLLVQ
jgi:nucleotide-binding universal stress UspA family protein